MACFCSGDDVVKLAGACKTGRRMTQSLSEDEKMELARALDPAAAAATADGDADSPAPFDVSFFSALRHV